MASLGTLDSCIVVASILVVFGAAAFATLRRRGLAAAAPAAGAESFFLAGRHMPWWLVGASLFASNIGTEHFVGQAGTAAAHGIAVGLYEWIAAYMVLALGWIFAPVYLRCALTTIPELLEKRFNKQCRFVFVMISLVAYAFSKIGSSLYAGVVVLEIVAGLQVWQSLPLILFATAVYTVAGGLEAVMLIDGIQMIIFLVGGALGSGIAFRLVGGMDGLLDLFNKEDLEYFPHLFRSPKDTCLPWPGMVFGIPIVSIWYWCVDQEMAQRVMSAKNLGEAQLGTSFAALFKSIPVFITVFPGMIARVLNERCLGGHSSDSTWCSINLGDPTSADRAYPLLVINEFPVGVKGIMVASFLAAMMSSLSSVFNSASTIFTYDIYLRFFNSEGCSHPKKLVAVGRLATVGTVLIAFGWIPIIASQEGGLFVLTQTAMSHLAPPVSALFVSALFLPSVNGQGAFIGLLTGTLLGCSRLFVFLFFDRSSCGDLPLVDWCICLNFNYFAILLFVISLAMIVIASFFFQPQDREQVADCLVFQPSAKKYLWSLWFSRRVKLQKMGYAEIASGDTLEGCSAACTCESEASEEELAKLAEAGGCKQTIEKSDGTGKQKIAAVVSSFVVLLISFLIVFFH